VFPIWGLGCWVRPTSALVVGRDNVCPIGNQRSVFVKQVGWSTVFLDDNNHMFDLRDLRVCDCCREYN
jgi:hypothetical protein